MGKRQHSNTEGKDEEDTGDLSRSVKSSQATENLSSDNYQMEIRRSKDLGNPEDRGSPSKWKKAEVMASEGVQVKSVQSSRKK